MFMNGEYTQNNLTDNNDFKLFIFSVLALTIS